MSVVTLDAFPTETSDQIIIVTGRVDGRVDSLEFGTDVSSLTPVSLSNKRFKVVLELSPGRNEFIFQPYDTSSNPLSTLREVITYYKQTPELVTVGNALDLHGERLGFDRLRGEKNVSYKKRLLQGAKKPNDRQGQPLSMATELAFPFSLNNVRISVQRTDYNRPKLTNPYIKVTLDEIQIAGNELVATDSPVVFDESYPYLTPENTISPFGRIVILNEAGHEMDPEEYEYDSDTDRILIKNRDYANKDLILAYNKIESYTLTGNDLATVKSTVESAGYINMEITDTDHHTSSTDADWLLPISWVPLTTVEDNPTTNIGKEPGVYLSTSEIKTFPLHEFKDDLLNSDGSGIGTALERYLKELNKVDRRTWGRVIVGQDGLRDGSQQPLFDYYPHLADPERGFWGTNEYNIHEVQYLGDGVNDTSNPLRGVQENQWHSGSGTEGDLEPDAVSQELQSFADITEEEKIPTNIIYGTL